MIASSSQAWALSCSGASDLSTARSVGSSGGAGVVAGGRRLGAAGYPRPCDQEKSNQ